ncbi:MAG: D-glycero-beta-D-manno-heptose-7-phosphate kinase [Magnetococcales bacterium]|nr:D-glycero-beta-D-manno-heptose-7-phosphate kinase [Magnetococcales bacterium]
MFTDRTPILQLIENRFDGKPILVVGDLMLDRYIWGSVSRISPEAPVPVVRWDRECDRCGGAANVVLNLARLGMRPLIAGLVGEDADGRRLLTLLTEAGCDTRSVLALPQRPTSTKTRIIGGHQQMLRLDREEADHPPPEAVQTLTEHLLARLEEADPPGAIILSDYNKGVLTPGLCQAVISAGRRLGIPVLVDPKGVDFVKYSGATVLCPNRLELATAIPAPIGDLDNLLQAGEGLRQHIRVDFLAVTLSELGIALVDGGPHTTRLPAVAREVFDVSGAGDTVIAVLGACLACGLPRLDALNLANLAAGVVVGKVGTYPIAAHELLEAVVSAQALDQSDKICSLETARSRVAAWKARKETVVFTNGCFDLLHAGHVTYLEAARNLGHRLVVGLNTDNSVSRLKGPRRPIIREEDRARVLAAMAAVDLVILFDEDTPLTLIRALEPDLLAKGADYREDQVVGGNEVKSWGGRVALVPLVAGRSTSRIVAEIREDAE